MKILGKAEATAQQMAKYLLSVNPNPKFSRSISVLEFCQLFLDICAEEGVRGDVAFAQSCNETGNFGYINCDVKYTQNNFAGIGAIGNGNSGHTFKTIEEGILGQAQHLKGYATKKKLNKPCVDPRRTPWFVKVNGGTCTEVEKLGGTWAVPGYNTKKYSSLAQANSAKDSYGYYIINILNKILKVKIKEESNMSNSSLVTYTRISPNRTSPRNKVIDTITIHCYVGQVTAKQGADYFANPLRGASSNYVVGYDGSIALVVEEKDRSWCSGGNKTVNGITGKMNDFRAITIEVACDKKAPYSITNAAMNALVKLVADIAKRNPAIKQLKWEGNPSLVGNVVKQNMTAHRWFASTACPGDYLFNNMGYIAQEANKILGITTSTNSAKPINRNYLAKGDKGEEVKKLQENLNYLGYHCGEADGIFGANTDSALRKFQKSYKLAVDGLYGISSKSTLEKAVAEKKDAVTTSYKYKGVDYSSVFNPTYYYNMYSDLRNAFGNNHKKLFNHFCLHGMNEGRRSCEHFDVNVYREYNADLQKAFGNNLPEYYKHYCKFGRFENRKVK